MNALLTFAWLADMGTAWNGAWFWLAMMMTLLHLTWMLSLVGAAGWTIARITKPNESERLYTVHLIALLACTVAIPVALFAGSRNATSLQQAFAMTAAADRTASTSDVNGSPSNTAGRETNVSSLRNERDEEEQNATSRTRENDGRRAENVELKFGPVPSDLAVELNLDLTASDAPSAPWSLFKSKMQFWLGGLAPWLTLTYVIGMVGMLIRLATNIRRCRQLVRSAVPVQEESLYELLSELAARLGCRWVPAPAASARVAGPVLVGVWRPMIVLPIAMVTGLTPQQWEPILLHELAHLRRYDHWVVLWQRVVEAFLFFHPAVWAISRQLEPHGMVAFI